MGDIGKAARQRPAAGLVISVRMSNARHDAAGPQRLAQGHCAGQLGRCAHDTHAAGPFVQQPVPQPRRGQGQRVRALSPALRGAKGTGPSRWTPRDGAFRCGGLCLPVPRGSCAASVPAMRQAWWAAAWWCRDGHEPRSRPRIRSGVASMNSTPPPPCRWMSMKPGAAYAPFASTLLTPGSSAGSVS